MDYCLWSSRLKDIRTLPFNGSNGVNKGSEQKNLLYGAGFTDKNQTQTEQPLSQIKSSLFEN